MRQTRFQRTNSTPNSDPTSSLWYLHLSTCPPVHLSTCPPVILSFQHRPAPAWVDHVSIPVIIQYVLVSRVEWGADRIRFYGGEVALVGWSVGGWSVGRRTSMSTTRFVKWNRLGELSSPFRYPPPPSLPTLATQATTRSQLPHSSQLIHSKDHRVVLIRPLFWCARWTPW